MGNGSVHPTKIWHIRFIDLFLRRRKEDDNIEARNVVSQRATLAEKKHTNILESFKIILQKDVALILLIPSIYYTIYVMGIPR